MRVDYKLPLEEECPFGADVYSDLNVLLAECVKRIPGIDLSRVSAAYFELVVGFKKANKERHSGDPYYTHPLKTALILLRNFNLTDEDTLLASLLHDNIEDLGTPPELFREMFGEKVLKLVDGVTKIKGEKTRQLDKAATYGKLFLALIEDIRVIFIKLADRLDNMKTLHHMPDSEKRKAIAAETLSFYVPFSLRLGLTAIRKDLEDLSLFFTDKDKYYEIKNALDRKQLEFFKFLTEFLPDLEKKLKSNGLKCSATIDHKHVNEIYNMVERGRPLEDIDNFYSVIITLTSNDYLDCYKAYGVVSNYYAPASSLDDYVSAPKINFYRALHSEHFGPEGKLVEIVIRTQEMDKAAERGLSARKIRENNYRALDYDYSEVEPWIRWMQDVIEHDENDGKAVEKIWGSISKNLYVEEITALTKDGKTYRLPKGSCLIDLAFAISRETGLSCISAKVDGKVESLYYVLKDKDRAEIITSKRSAPQPEWQDHAITFKALVELYRYFRNNPKPPEGTKKSKVSKYTRFKIRGENRPQMLTAITEAIGQVNIVRINLTSSESFFEGSFTLHLEDKNAVGAIYAKLLQLKGMKKVDITDGF